MSETKTISLAGSDKLYWEDIEKYSNEHGFTTTSGYIQYLLEKDILGLKAKLRDAVLYVIVLLIMAMIVLLLLLR